MAHRPIPLIPAASRPASATLPAEPGRLTGRAAPLAASALVLLGTAALCAQVIVTYVTGRAHDQAETLRKDGQYDRAWSALDAALKLRPASPDLWTELGQTYRAAWFFRGTPELWRSAVQAYERAEALHPLSATPPTELARTLALGEQYAAANRAYARALRRDPRNPGLLVDRAQTLEALGQRAEALALYRQAARIKPNEYSQAAETRLGQAP